MQQALNTGESKGRPTAREIDHAVHDAIVRRLPPERTPRDVAASGLRLEADLGLSSLDVAEIVADLDARLSSPAHDRLPIADFRTVGDLCLACRCRLLGEPPSSTEPDALLAASRRRGEARRRRSVR